MANELQITGNNLEAGSGFVAAGLLIGQQLKAVVTATETGGEGTVIDDDFIVTVIIAGDTPVDQVLARYSNLSVTETDAITDFVNGLVADGVWNSFTEIYAPCLNGVDFLIGMKHMTLVPSASPPVHVPGEYVDFTNNSMHYLDPDDFDTFATVNGFMGVYNVFTAADVTSNSDLFGTLSGANQILMRWRGDDTDDFNTLYNVDNVTPRTGVNIRPTGDFVGIGLEGADIFNMAVGGAIGKAARTSTPVPAGFPMQWHGQNQNGTPAAGNMQNSRYSLMVHANNMVSDAASLLVRPRVLQFLRDIGVTGVPAT